MHLQIGLRLKMSWDRIFSLWDPNTDLELHCGKLNERFRVDGNRSIFSECLHMDFNIVAQQLFDLVSDRAHYNVDSGFRAEDPGSYVSDLQRKLLQGTEVPINLHFIQTCGLW